MAGKGNIMDVTISNVITIYRPTQQIVDWCKKNLVLSNPEYDKKLRMGFWTGKTPRTIELFEKVGNYYYLPFGTLKSIWPLIKESEPEIEFWEPEIVDYGGHDVPLYDYQQKAVDRMVMARYGILQSPAGSGKTQMGIALVKYYNRRALWITHTADLLNQSKQRALQYIDENVIGTITEGKINIGKGITFATVQTLANIDLVRYKNYWDVIIVDEAHHVSGSPTTVTQYSRVLNNLSARHKYGLSATAHRSDGLIEATFALIGGIAYTVPEDSVSTKIMRVGVYPQATGVGLSNECLNPDGTLSYTGMIGYLTKNEDRNRRIIDDVIKERDHSCLILSDRLEHLAKLITILPPEMQAYAPMISGRTDKDIRNRVLESMRQGKLKYLFATYSLAKEGLDIPRLDRLFMATPIKDYAVVVQALGRIARTYPGKEAPIAYDYVDNIGYCKSAYKQRTRHYKKINAYYVGD